MAITKSLYSESRQILFTNRFDSGSFVYAAQLLGQAYTFDSSHSTRADIAGALVGLPVILTSKTLTRSGAVITLDCADIDTTPQGALDAAYCVIHLMNTGSPLTTDKLLMFFNLNENKTVSVNSPLVIADDGLIKVS